MDSYSLSGSLSALSSIFKLTETMAFQVVATSIQNGKTNAVKEVTPATCVSEISTGVMMDIYTLSRLPYEG